MHCIHTQRMKQKTSLVSRSVNRLLWYVVLVAVFPCSCPVFSYARDVIQRDSPLRDVLGETIVSAGEIFELGFFSPKGNHSAGRYVGIWYKFSTDTVVWVANRDKPIRGPNGVFGIHEDGYLEVFDDSRDEKDQYYWKSENEASETLNLTAKLTDSGNLVLGEALWQSFENPTDTFLPGMKMREGLNLTSWEREDDPQVGEFMFLQDDQGSETHYIIINRYGPYWKSGGKLVDSHKMVYPIPSMLSNTSIYTVPVAREYRRNKTDKNRATAPEYGRKRTNENRTIVVDYSGTRLVITLYGKIEYKTWDKNNKSWTSTWSAPEENDKCSVFNACGNFGSCSAADNDFPCKCLPGFEPNNLLQWNSGDFTSGCNRRGLKTCGDTFLNLTKMNVAKPEYPNNRVTDERACKMECLGNCQCKAYSFRGDGPSTLRKASDSKHRSCWLWFEELQDLQEGFEDGQNLSVRVASTDLGSTMRNCEPCGTNEIPYPLSTRKGCGDARYFRFQCNISIGAVTFQTASGAYQVARIDHDVRKFIIEVPHLENCDAKNSSGESFLLDRYLPFHVTNWCFTNGSGNFKPQVSDERTRKVEIEWDLPGEPPCDSDTDCKEWPNSSCENGINNAEKRCHCNTNFRWDFLSFNCTQSKENGTMSSRKSTHIPLIAGATVVSTAVLACVCIAFIIRSRKFSKKQEENRSKNLIKLDTQKHIKHLINSGEFVEEDEEAIDVPFFNFESIKAATDDFSDENKLGQGGYGPVYKGIFPGGQEIAVKRLSSFSGQGLQEFKNEVVLIAKLQHRNLVRLRGYCVKGDEKILLYEYMPNKSLDSFLFDNTQSGMLDWDKRFDIILGIARGLLYLHQDSRLRIIHRDLKTSNILLDQEMKPKISDFGLARVVGGAQTEANTERVVGTYGYMSPEYAIEGLFSVKSDVFSFGVVLLEIISGKRNTRLVQYQQPLSLLGYAWKLWTENNVLELLDSALHQSYNEEQFVKCLKVALLCVQEDPSERPNMSSVVTMLDSESATVATPQQPAFVLKTGSYVASSSSSKPDETRTEITATLEGR